MAKTNQWFESTIGEKSRAIILNIEGVINISCSLNTSDPHNLLPKKVI
jgi:hypothetical protein